MRKTGEFDQHIGGPFLDDSGVLRLELVDPLG